MTSQAARSRPPVPFPSPAGLSDDARKAITQSFEALQEWRQEVAGSTEKYADNVFDKMGAAAKSMGWPDNMIEASKSQMKQISQMQLTMIDQIMDAWQAQVKSPGSMPALPSFPTSVPGMGAFPGAAGMPQMPGLAGLSMAPLQFWMQAAEMWQKTCQQAVAQMVDMQQSMIPGSNDRRR